MQQQHMQPTPIRWTAPILTGCAFLLAGVLMTPSYAQQDAADPLPRAEDILDKHVEATGGKQARLALTSRKSTGKLEVKMSGHEFVADVEEHYLAPNKSHISITGDFFAQVSVCNGKHAWDWRPSHGHGQPAATSDSGETTLLTGEEKFRALAKADFHSTVRWRKQFTSVKTIGMAFINNAPAYEVQLTTKTKEQYSQFYDKTTGRLVKRTRKRGFQGGEIDMEIFFEDYREFDAIWMPTTIRMIMRSEAMGEGTQTWTYSKIEHNKKISSSLFKLPEELRDRARQAEEEQKQAADSRGVERNK